MGEMNHIHNLPHSLEAYIGEQSLRTKAAFLWRDYHIVILGENKFIFTRERETKYEILNDVWSVAGLLREVTERRIVDLKNLDDISALIWQLLLAWRYFKERVSGIYPFAHNEHSDALMRFIADPLASMQVYTLFGVNYRRFAPLDRCTLGVIMTDYLARVHHDIDFVRCIFSDSTYLATEYVSEDAKRIAASLYSRYAAAGSRDLFFLLFESGAIYPLLDALLVAPYSFSNEEWHLVSVISNELRIKKYDPKKVLLEVNTETFMVTCRSCRVEYTFETIKTYKGTCKRCFDNMPVAHKPPNVRLPILTKDQFEILARDFEGKKEIPCPICRKSITQETKEFGHIVPVARGGGSTADNIICICGTCNRKMGTMDYYEYKQLHDAARKALREDLKMPTDFIIEMGYTTDENDFSGRSIPETVRTMPNSPRNHKTAHVPLQVLAPIPNIIKPQKPPKTKEKKDADQKRRAFDIKNINSFLAEEYVPCKSSHISVKDMYEYYTKYCVKKHVAACSGRSFLCRIKDICKTRKDYSYNVKEHARVSNICRKST